jgi:TPR repeat protein
MLRATKGRRSMLVDIWDQILDTPAVDQILDTHASCLFAAGSCLVFGRGVETNLVYGMVLVTRAADGGSAGAANFLGESFEHGTEGLPKDLVQAKEWYEKVASAKVHDLHPNRVEMCAAYVLELSSG